MGNLNDIRERLVIMDGKATEAIKLLTYLKEELEDFDAEIAAIRGEVSADKNKDDRPHKKTKVEPKEKKPTVKRKRRTKKEIEAAKTDATEPEKTPELSKAEVSFIGGSTKEEPEEVA